jgi:hypothetical protein
MKISGGHALTGFAGVLVICHVTFGQVSLTPNLAPFLTSDQLTVVATTEAAARSIVSQALAEHVRSFPNKTTTVIGAQIPENWLPAIPGVQFLRLTDDAARAHLQRCDRILWVKSFRLLTDELATVAVAEGNSCSDSGLDLRFRRLADGWHLNTDGVPGGFASGTSECSCR